MAQHNGELVLSDYMKNVAEEFPDFRLIPKEESRLCSAIDVFLRVVSLGAIKAFKTGYLTTIGNTVYVPTIWDAMSEQSQLVSLRHERVHMRQRQRMGVLWYTFMYLFVFFPMFLAWGRARLEKEAYAETILASSEIRGKIYVYDPRYKEWIIQQFVGEGYLWMWPFKDQIGSWFDSIVSKL